MKKMMLVMLITLMITSITPLTAIASQVHINTLASNHKYTSGNTYVSWNCLEVEFSGIITINSIWDLSLIAASGFPIASDIGSTTSKYALQMLYKPNIFTNLPITINPMLGGQHAIQHYYGGVNETKDSISSGLHILYLLQPGWILVSGLEFDLWSRLYLLAGSQQELSTTATGQRFFAEIRHQTLPWQLVGGVRLEVNHDTFNDRLPRLGTGTSIYIGGHRYY